MSTGYGMAVCENAYSEPVSMMLLCMIVKLVELVDRIEMRKTDCFGRTRLVLHIPSSS